jgi:aminoglycoside phosphotransferase family enzyme/predicted kinase
MTLWPTRVTETHVSTLFFLGDRVYKLKKPVRTAFLDWSTPERRRRACLEEVALNRRIAPDVYQGIVDVVGHDGVTCDSLVVMRRLPTEKSLASRLQAGTDLTAPLRSLARLLADFHSGCRHDDAVARAGRADAVAHQWAVNGDEMLGHGSPRLLDSDQLARVSMLSSAYIEGRASLFAARVAAGRIRDGHGDLLADDIFVLDDGLRVLDCLEFDPQLRYGDVLADVAFLAMDLERLGAASEAARFLAWYKEYSADSWPDSLAHHWIAYRAVVRSKVECLRADQGDPGAARRAASLLDLCLQHLEMAQVRLVLVGGLPGRGKTTIASGLADRLGWALLSSDETRHHLGGDESGGSGFREGLYAPAVTDKTYSTLLDEAGRCLALGQHVIVDATWTDRRWRALAADLADRYRSVLVEIECRAPDDLAAARIQGRLARRTGLSDATPEVARLMAAKSAPWPTARPIDTVGDAGAAVERAVNIAYPWWENDALLRGRASLTFVREEREP